MEPRIRTLEIEHFRSFRHLKIDGLGRVNLLTGLNNSGKSSVLEAVRLLASGASPTVLRSILRAREELTDEGQRRIDIDEMFQLSSLFTGFPRISEDIPPIQIAAFGGDKPIKLSMGISWLLEERGQDGSVRRVLQPKGSPGEAGRKLGLVIEAGKPPLLLPADYLPNYLGRSFGSMIPVDESCVPCVFVSPFDGERTAHLGLLWDKIALSDREKEVVEALRIVVPGILGVNMVGEGRGGRTAIVKTTEFSEPVPLRSFGDGLNRLFSIALSLVNAQKGLLLIDEFENGMHYSVQTDIWRIIFRLAKELDVQVLATTHSNDAIAAFQRVANETGEDGVLVNLRREDDDVYSTIFSKEELAIATLNQIEVR